MISLTWERERCGASSFVVQDCISLGYTHILGPLDPWQPNNSQNIHSSYRPALLCSVLGLLNKYSDNNHRLGQSGPTSDPPLPAGGDPSGSSGRLRRLTDHLSHNLHLRSIPSALMKRRLQKFGWDTAHVRDACSWSCYSHLAVHLKYLGGLVQD